MKKWDVVLIGSGISSLTAAALLAKRGKSVCVLEQYVKPGGYLHCFNRFGLQFDTGSHYIGAMDSGQAFRVILEYLGIYRDDLFIPLDPEGFDVFEFPSFKVAFAKGYETTIDNLVAQFPKERAAIESYFALIRKTAGLFPTYALRADSDTPALLQAMETPLSTIVEKLTADEKLKSVLYTYCAIHGVRPEDVSIGMHALATDSMIQSPYGFRRGGDALTQGFVRVIRENGGEVRVRSRVNKIHLAGKTAVGVELENGEVLHGETIISGAHPKTTFRFVDPTVLSPAFRQRLDRTKETLAIFGIYAAMKDVSAFDRRKNYYFFRNESTPNLLNVDGPLTPPCAVFVCSPDRCGESPVGKNPMTFHSPGPIDWFSDWRDTRVRRRPEPYYDLKDKIACNVLSFVERYRPGTRESVIEFDSSSPLSNLHFNGSEEGSAYGIYHSIQNTGVRALGPRTPIRNLLLTGQSSLTPGLLGATISGIRTVETMLGGTAVLEDLIRYRGIA